MSTSRILQPVASDPDARLQERLASLEARLAAIESRKDLTITPLGTMSASGSTRVNKVYTYRGGRVWVMWWGTVVTLTTGFNFLGIDIYINGTPIGIASSINGDGAVMSTYTTQPSFQEFTGVLLTVPTLTFGFERVDANVSSWTGNAFVMEWPQS